MAAWQIVSGMCSRCVLWGKTAAWYCGTATSGGRVASCGPRRKERRVIRRESGEVIVSDRDLWVKIGMTTMWVREKETENVTGEKARLSPVVRWARNEEGHTKRGNEKGWGMVQEVWGEERRG